MADTQKKSDQVVLEEIVNDLLSMMGTSATATVTEDKENEALTVDIQSEDETGLLIGSRGDTLRSLQTIAGIMLKNKQGEWRRVLLNIADWREKQEQRLKDLAESTAQKVKETGESSSLYNLSSGERRTVHMYLSEDDDVVTESVGEGEERHLVVQPKK